MEFPEYRQAVIHLSWFRDDQVRHLLFGMVELRPNELPDTVSCPRKDFRAKNKSRKYLHYQRFALSVPDAIDWYQKMIDGNLILPEDNEKLKDITFVQEPPWPHFVTSNELVFAPDWMHGSRTHFLFSKNVLSPEVSEIIRINKNRTKLEEWLNFDIVEAYSDYLGAICLVAPNPLFRSIEKSHFEEAREGADETVAYKLVARQGQCLNGLRLEVVNERLRGRMMPFVHEFYNNAIVILDFPTEIYKEGRLITHPKYGLLDWHGPLPILRAIHVTMEVQQRRKRVQVPDRSHKQIEYEYNADEFEDDREIIVGDVSEDSDIVPRLIKAENRRSHRQTASDYDQQWFYRTPSDAVEYVRQKIGNARDTVFIVDPYFGSRELLAFGHAVSRPGIDFRILTSTQGLDTASGSKLLNILNNTFKTYPTKPEIRILTGKRSPVHDRFLVVDGTVWFFGNSLNTIGECAGMIVRLPDPKPVIARLDAFWNQAPALSDWLSKRSASATPRKGYLRVQFNRLMARILS